MRSKHMLYHHLAHLSVALCLFTIGVLGAAPVLSASGEVAFGNVATKTVNSSSSATVSDFSLGSGTDLLIVSMSISTRCLESEDS